MRKLPIGVETDYEFDSYQWVLKTLKLFSNIFGNNLFYQPRYEYVRGEKLIIKLVDLLNENRVIYSQIFFPLQFDFIDDPKILEEELEMFAKSWRKDILYSPKLNQLKTIKLTIPVNYKLLSISKFLFSPKNQKEVFELIIADWNDEIYEVLEKNKDASLFIINARYTYAFIVAMWMKSPIGSLIELVIKIAKP